MQQRGEKAYGENEWREIGSKITAAVRLDIGHFLAASTFVEGALKYTIGWMPCFSYTASPFRLVRACSQMPSDLLSDLDSMEAIFDKSFVNGLFEKSPTYTIEISNT